MKNIQRQYPLLSACGLNCGLCPRYHTDGTSKCPGCAGKSFLMKHPSCGILSCCQRHGGIEYCYQCDEYPCKRYDGADSSDSFITHRNQLKDFKKVKKIGLGTYQSELNEKVEILLELLLNYNDGRQKSFFCIAINLLELTDVKEVMAHITEAIKPDSTLKEKSLSAVTLFKNMAEKRNITLKLNKTKRPKGNT
ncbi:MAG: DUF3795 domain-containing protein [Clostridiales bacterium]|nr:DUF3795 domain-containing protein [Clostridiales bacterium]